jgi:hypothetical protein
MQTAQIIDAADPDRAGSRPHRLRGGSWRLGPLRDLEHPSDLFANLGPNWFASIMGTGT